MQKRRRELRRLFMLSEPSISLTYNELSDKIES